MAATTQEKVASLIDSAKFAGDMPSKLDHLRQLKEDWFMEEDAFSLSEFLHYLFDLHTDRFSPVRKFVVAMIGEIGLKHVELLPEIAPVLTTVLKDTTPAVARQAISCGINLFRHVLEKVALQGLYSSELDESLESAWAWMLKFKDHMYSVAFQPGSDSIRLLALKFVEAIVVLYTPDPSGSSEPPHPQAFEGNLIEFNVAWLRGGHPVLSVRDLSVEASQSLALLLDQLRFPTIRSLSCPMIIVLINSLATIAKRRPSFYGRILPVLLGLDPPSSNIKGVHVSGARHALKNAFLSCLNCTLPGAVPWRERLVDALREMKAGDQEVATLGQVYKIKGSSDETKENILIKEEKSMVRASNAVHSSTGTKRLAVPGQCDFVEDAELSGKRTRLDASASEGSSEGPKRDRSLFQDDITSVQTASSRGDGDTGPVQQLSAMFGALVAQGEKAVGSLEILMSSISADLLAEVVMTNMRYLPSSLPQAEDNDDPFLKMNSEGSDAKVKHSPSIFIDILSLSNALPKMSSLLEALRSRAENVARPQVEEECRIKKPQVKEECHAVASTLAATNAVSVAVSEIPDVGNLVGEIPGLGSVSLHHGSKETHTSCLAPTKLEGAIQEKVTSPGKRSILNVHPSISTDKSEELSQSIFADSSSIISSTATSVVASNQFVLPKMSAPVVNLHDEEKDQVQKLVFIRIVDAYKQVAAAGGLHARSSLLVNLAVEFPLELDPWAFLHEHILSDYTNHEGHELTLRVLYRLFGEAEVEHDFFSSTTATSVYETFILKVAETLRDSFAASDKSLSRLLGEAPYLPKSVFSMLESLCSSEKCDKDEESHTGDRVTQGLSTVWNLILLRPPLREACLKIALQSAVHRLEEVRMKAIRLVANKLYPLPYIAQRIEDFAKEMLFSVINSVDGSEKADVNGSLYSESHKDTDMVKTSAEHPLASSSGKDVSDHHQSSTSPSISSYSISEAQRCMSLYFALCTKKHSMLRGIFLAYNSASKDVKQAVHRHIPLLVRTMGSSLDLLDIMSDPPSGSEGLLMQVLHTLTDGAIPSPELISTVKKLYDSKVKDVEILIPVLPYLPKDEVMQVFSHFINLPSEKFQVALARILQGSSHSGPVLTPAEVLIAIHGIDPERDGIPLKKVTDACNACFEQRQIFTQQVLAKVLNQLVEQIPLPLLFMRTVLQAIGAFPGLVEFVMEILSRLVSKQIWKSPKLWVGFLKCAQLTQPTSFSVLLQLPPAQLENALNRSTALKAPLVAHASQPKVRSSLPRSVLVVLGIATDSQSSSHAQTSKGLTADASGKEGAMEKNRGSSTAS